MSRRNSNKTILQIDNGKREGWGEATYCKALKTYRYRDLYCAGENCNKCYDYIIAKTMLTKNKLIRVPVKKDVDIKTLKNKYGLSTQLAYACRQRGYVCLNLKNEPKVKNKDL